ncbi:hypothetical protein DVK85_08975 [Flavobacterium arcticum]|uniref:DoxX family membrane protein n=1 Tax=Flavobacterium arcticum TaxID=1784713 RepID=A0A345HCP5_9FLAO|nr:hypothetical protein [Flavobacterium arcticum]AXG74355.1 hypothetical protein DVK85_08975 [Flavobacterium arcticum]KAF2507530.1 hypothetical protein E0W72_11675 [Flavobacterium arcticum]
MKPLFVLLLTFLLATGIFKIFTTEYQYVKSGTIALCCMLLLTAIGHFKFTSGMALMLPDFIPAKRFIIYSTGFLEILLAIAFLFPKYRYAAGIIFIIFLILSLPFNIYAAIKHVNYETASYDGKGLLYLWFRIPMQLFLIVWTLIFALRVRFF